jgi:hypothetical protein
MGQLGKGRKTRRNMRNNHQGGGDVQYVLSPPVKRNQEKGMMRYNLVDLTTKTICLKYFKGTLLGKCTLEKYST